MSEKHTPGPWKAVNGHYIVDVRANKQSIIGEGMRLADARLIAAAPDMLAALDRAVQDIDSGWAEDADTRFPWLASARAAIAKAEGSAP